MNEEAFKFFLEPVLCDYGGFNQVVDKKLNLKYPTYCKKFNGKPYIKVEVVLELPVKFRLSVIQFEYFDKYEKDYTFTDGWSWIRLPDYTDLNKLMDEVKKLSLFTSAYRDRLMGLEYDAIMKKIKKA